MPVVDTPSLGNFATAAGADSYAPPCPEPGWGLSPGEQRPFS